MSNEFMREERYIVFKMSDLGNSLKGDEIRRLAREYAEYRQRLRKKPLECVVVEKDWPEYEPTWRAIEARVTGAPYESVVQVAARIMNHELITERDALRSEYSRLQKEADKFEDGIDWIQRALQAEAKVEEMRGRLPCQDISKWPNCGAQPAPNVVAYLDIGAGGYMDIGTDLTDEELDAIPKGRHMLGIVGTYGIDGYSPAQPAPSIKDAIIDDLQSQFDSDGITEHDSGDALIRLSAAIAAVEDNFAGAQPEQSVPEGFSREDLEAVADGLDGYEKTVNVGNVTGEGDDHLESTTAYAARFIRAMLAAPEAKP